MLHRQSGPFYVSMCYWTVHKGLFSSWCSIILSFLKVPRNQISLPLQEQNGSRLPQLQGSNSIRHRTSQHSNTSGQLALNDLDSHVGRQQQIQDFLTLYPQQCYVFCAISWVMFFILAIYVKNYLVN